MKRRMLCLCLCALLCAGAVTALAAPGDAVLYPWPEGNAFLSSVAIQPDGVYALLNATLVTRWRPGDEAPETLFDLEAAPAPEGVAWPDADIHMLVPGDDGLYALNLTAMKLARVSDTGYDFLDTKLDMPEMESLRNGYPEARQVHQAFVWEDGLFLLLGNVEAEDREARFLYRVPLSGGPLQAYDTEGVGAAAPYQPGTLLVAVVSPDGSLTGRDLCPLDIGSGQMGPPLKTRAITSLYDTSGLAYVPVERAVYYESSGQVWRLDADTGEARAIAVLPGSIAAGRPGSAGSVGVLSGGFFADAQFDGIYIRNIDPAYWDAPVLRFAGAVEDAVYSQFTEKHPEMPVLPDFAGLTAEATAKSLRSSEHPADLYAIYEYGKRALLLEGGYAADLSGSRAIAEEVAGMYPAVQAALVDDQGVLRAYPTQLSFTALVVDTSLFEATFPGEALPETWEEFLTLYLRYLEAPTEGVAFLNNAVDRDGMVQYLVGEFFLQYGRAGQAVDFRHPALRSVLQLAARLPDLEEGYYDADKRGEINARRNIFAITQQWMQGMGQEWEVREDGQPVPMEIQVHKTLLPPVFEPGQAPVTQGKLELIAVNPDSPHLDYALRFLETIAENLDPRVRYALCPALSEPVRYDDHERMQALTLKTMEEVREALPGLSGEERAAQEERLARLEESLALKEARWMVAPDALEAYRAIAPAISFAQNGTFDAESKPVGLLTRDYTGGEIPLEEFLAALNELAAEAAKQPAQ